MDAKEILARLSKNLETVKVVTAITNIEDPELAAEVKKYFALKTEITKLKDDMEAKELVMKDKLSRSIAPKLKESQDALFRIESTIYKFTEISKTSVSYSDLYTMLLSKVNKQIQDMMATMKDELTKVSSYFKFEEIGEESDPKTIKKIMKEKTGNLTLADLKRDEVFPIWVVTRPTSSSVIEDIVFEVPTLAYFMNQFRGGLKEDEVVALYTKDNQENAKAFGEQLLKGKIEAAKKTAGGGLNAQQEKDYMAAVEIALTLLSEGPKSNEEILVELKKESYDLSDDTLNQAINEAKEEAREASVKKTAVETIKLWSLVETEEDGQKGQVIAVRNDPNTGVTVYTVRLTDGTTEDYLEADLIKKAKKEQITDQQIKSALEKVRSEWDPSQPMGRTSDLIRKVADILGVDYFSIHDRVKPIAQKMGWEFTPGAFAVKKLQIQAGVWDTIKEVWNRLSGFLSSFVSSLTDSADEMETLVEEAEEETKGQVVEAGLKGIF